MVNAPAKPKSKPAPLDVSENGRQQMRKVSVWTPKFQEYLSGFRSNLISIKSCNIASNIKGAEIAVWRNNKITHICLVNNTVLNVFGCTFCTNLCVLDLQKLRSVFWSLESEQFLDEFNHSHSIQVNPRKVCLCNFLFFFKSHLRYFCYLSLISLVESEISFIHSSFQMKLCQNCKIKVCNTLNVWNKV